MTKKLAKLPIGTYLELSYGDSGHRNTISGIITDSDFSENIQITSETGDESIIALSIVLSIDKTKSLEFILKELSPGTLIHFSYGEENQREPNLFGTVVENDNEVSIAIKTSSGDELILNYALIRSLLIKSAAATPTASAPFP